MLFAVYFCTPTGIVDWDNGQEVGPIPRVTVAMVTHFHNVHSLAVDSACEWHTNRDHYQEVTHQPRWSQVFEFVAKKQTGDIRFSTRICCEFAPCQNQCLILCKASYHTRRESQSLEEIQRLWIQYLGPTEKRSAFFILRLSPPCKCSAFHWLEKRLPRFCGVVAAAQADSTLRARSTSPKGISRLVVQ